MQYIDILILTEIKLDDTFPTVQLLLSGFSKPCRLGRNRNRENVLIYICENIQSKLLDKHVELIFGHYFLEHITHIPSRYFDNIDKAFDNNSSY